MRAQRIGWLHPRRGLVRVKTGFSWPAFFLGGLWACAKGLWLAAGAMLILDAAIWFCSGWAQAHGEATLALGGLGLQLAYCILRGWYANAWWRARLLRLGYRPTPRRVT